MYAGRGVSGDFVADAVVVVELAVAAPADGDLELTAGGVGRESAAEQIKEEPGSQIAVGAAGQRFTDGAHQRGTLARLGSEDLLAVLDISSEELGSDVGEGQFAAADGDEVKHGHRVDERKQIVDREIEFVGKSGEPDVAAVGVDHLDEAAQSADRGVGKRLGEGSVRGGFRDDFSGFPTGE